MKIAKAIGGRVVKKFSFYEIKDNVYLLRDEFQSEFYDVVVNGVHLEGVDRIYTDVNVGDNPLTGHVRLTFHREGQIIGRVLVLYHQTLLMRMVDSTMFLTIVETQ